MITNIPLPSDFFHSGIALLNLSWDKAISPLMYIEGLKEHESYDYKEEEHDFWNAAQNSLRIALALIQQSMEFILKGKIAEVSPYLLISKNPRNWPANCNRQNTDFTDFYTINSEDLIRVHDTVTQNRINDVLATKFTDLRKKRNAIVHSVSANAEKIFAIEIIKTIFLVYHNLFDGRSWIQARQKFLEEDTEAQLHSKDHVQYQTCHEFFTLIEHLEASELKTYYGITKSQRSYICPSCFNEFLKIEGDGHEKNFPKSARLNPNTPTSNTVQCFVCGHHQVKRETCKKNNCRGNVISNEEICLTCGKAVNH